MGTFEPNEEQAIALRDDGAAVSNITYEGSIVGNICDGNCGRARGRNSAAIGDAANKRALMSVASVADEFFDNAGEKRVTYVVDVQTGIARLNGAGVGDIAAKSCGAAVRYVRDYDTSAARCRHRSAVADHAGEIPAVRDRGDEDPAAGRRGDPGAVVNGAGKMGKPNVLDCKTVFVGRDQTAVADRAAEGFIAQKVNSRNRNAGSLRRNDRGVVRDCPCEGI